MGVNALRKSTFDQKRKICILSPVINEGVGEAEVDLSVSQSYRIANLPEDSLIVNAYIWTKGVSDAATSAAVTLGTTEGGTQIMTAGNLKAAGKSGTFTGVSDTGSGVPVWFNATITGASTNVGEYVVIVEYIEYTLKTGEYTNVNA